MNPQTAEEQSVEYVELVDYDESEPITDQSGPEAYDVQIDENPENVVSSNPEEENNPETQEVEYLEAEELDENNTIIIHNGKQYIIPTDKLNQAGNTIILENEEEISVANTENDLLDPELCENIIYSDANSENKVLVGQFAYLKDGKLFLDRDHVNENENEEETTSNNDDIEQKIRDFAETIQNFQEDDEYNEENEQQTEENDEVLEQITGKNLITGQTISLSGFLEKLRKRGIKNEVNVSSTSTSRRSTVDSSKLGSDYVLVPPVTRRVVVGKTINGKKLVGKILQIQKKVPPPNETTQIPVPRQQIQRQTRRRAFTTSQQSESNPSSDPLATLEIPELPYTPLLDENIARTLSGLMDLESVSKSLVNRKLIVKHVQRKSVGGKVLTGSRKVAFYSGNMIKNDINGWTFVSDMSDQRKTSSGIDILDSNDDQTVRWKLEGQEWIQEVTNPEPEEYINLFLTVTVDEYNKKRTKVSIPQLGQQPSRRTPNVEIKDDPDAPSNHICEVCNKKFQSAASLRRHFQTHNPNLRPLQCLQCLARFYDKSSLKKHLLLHSGLKPHSCTICSKNFAHKSDLNCHLKTHNSIKQYQCSVCLKTFHRHSNMIRHKTIHQTNRSNDGSQGNSSDNNEVATDSEKYPPFCCEQCGSCFNYVSSLTRHIVTHHLIGESTVSSNALESS